MTLSPRSMQTVSCVEPSFQNQWSPSCVSDSTRRGFPFAPDVGPLATGLRPENGATRKSEAMALWGDSTAGLGLEEMGRDVQNALSASRVSGPVVDADALLAPISSGPQCMADGVHVPRDRRADPQHIAREGIRHVQSGPTVIAWEHCTETLLCVESIPDTSLYTQVLLLRITLTRGMRVLPSVAFINSGFYPMRYTITVTDRPNSKSRYRAALRMLGAENIRIEEAEEVDQPKPKKDNVPTSPEAKAVADLFNRKHSTEWADEEITVFRKAIKSSLLTMENITLVAAHYRKNRGVEGAYLRTSLLTFLRHFGTELDKARAVKPASRKLEWAQDSKVVPMPSQEEQDRIAAQAKEAAEQFRKTMRQ